MESKLKELRAAKDESQQDLSDYLKICVRSLIRYENGEKMPRLEIGYKIADHYGVAIEEVFPPCYYCKDSNVINLKAHFK